MAWEGDLGVKTNQYEGDNAINYVGDPNLKQLKMFFRYTVG